MKQQFKPKTIAAAIVALTALVLVSTSYVQAQSINQPNIPALKPGAIVIPPSQQHGPSLAQIRSDIATHQLNTAQYVQSVINLINQRLANNPNIAHASQVLKQLTAEGKINCPAPFTNPGHCFLTPKPAGIAPPIG